MYPSKIHPSIYICIYIYMSVSLSTCCFNVVVYNVLAHRRNLQDGVNEVLFQVNWFINMKWRTGVGKLVGVKWRIYNELVTTCIFTHYWVWYTHSYQGARCSSVVERQIMVRWVIGTIPYGGPIELFLIPTCAPWRVYQMCGMSAEWCC